MSLVRILLRSGKDYTDLRSLEAALAMRGIGSYRPSLADVDCDTLEFTMEGDTIVYIVYDWKPYETNY